MGCDPRFKKLSPEFFLELEEGTLKPPKPHCRLVEVEVKVEVLELE